MTNDQKKAAQEWVDSRVWANGWDVTADGTIDAVQFKKQYEANKDLWDKLFSYLANVDLSTLKPGEKVVLVPEKLWIVNMEYTPKCAEESNIETHRKYVDLQYTYEGNEIMGLADGACCTPKIDYDPVKDKQFFNCSKPSEFVPADPGRFFLYFPSDYHQPSVKSCDDPGVTHKILGKIAFAEV